MTPSNGITDGLLCCLTVSLVVFPLFKTLNLLLIMSRTMACNNETPKGEFGFNLCKHSGLFFVGVLMHTFDPLCVFK
jgi:hypothetical protein